MCRGVTRRTIFAVLIAGAVGTIGNALAAALFLGPERIDLALVPSRYAVAIVVAALLPLALLVKPWPAGSVLALVMLTTLPSVLAKFVFAAASPWSTVVSLNAVYAVTALVAYLVVLRLFREADPSANP